MRKSNGFFETAIVAAVAVLGFTGNAGAAVANETITYTTTGTYKCTLPADVEIYALGAGGGGEGGHYYKCNISGNKYVGTGAGGGGGGAVYAKLRIRQSSDIKISQLSGKGGSGGEPRDRTNCNGWLGGIDGETVPSTIITVGGYTITANSGVGGGEAVCGDCIDNGGGSGGTATIIGAANSSVTLLDSAKMIGGKGDDGQKDGIKNRKGGNAALISNKGYYSSFGGSAGGYSSTSQYGGQVGSGAGAGGSGGYSGSYSGGNGAAGQVKIVVTHLWTVKFDSTYGYVVNQNPITDVLNGNAIARPTGTPTRTGYEFVDWYPVKTGGEAWNFSKGITKDTTLYARWTADKYGITYNLNGGINNPNPSEYTIETSTITLGAPTREHFTFGGWYENSTFSGSQITSIVKGSTGAKTYWAKWIPIECTVTFNSQGGSPTPPDRTVNSGDTISEPSVKPAKDGTAFFGWFKDMDGKYQWNFANDIVGSNITLYAAYGANRLGLLDEEFIYNGKPQKLGTIKLLKSEGGWVDLVEGTHFDAVYKNNTNSGTASATITCKGDYSYISVQEIFFTVRKREISVSWYNTNLTWNGELQAPTPMSSDNNFPVAVTQETLNADAGTYTAEALPLDTNVLITMNQKVSYKINPQYVQVRWENTLFTYNGEEQIPTATIVDEDFPVTVKPYFESINAGNYTAEAVLTTANRNIVLTGNTTPYQIVKKEVRVEWENTGPFEYNKMVQAPKAIIKTGDDMFDTLALSVSNSHSQVGKYTGQQAAIASIIDQRIAPNITLTNNTCDYEITKRPLEVVLTKKKYEDDPDDNERVTVNKVSVARKPDITVGGVIDSLKTLIGYDGFAVDTLKNEADNESVLSGEPRFEISKLETGTRSRSKRDGVLKISDLLENGEYTVNIKVSDIFAQNYALNDGQAVLKVSDSSVTFSMSRDGDDTPIRDKKKPDSKHGILLEKAVVSHLAKINVKTPEQAQVNLVIYDNAGNAVYKTSGKNIDTFVWNLTNNAGRNVANGTYLIVVEAKGAKGNYAYSAKVGVKR